MLLFSTSAWLYGVVTVVPLAVTTMPAPALASIVFLMTWQPPPAVVPVRTSSIPLALRQIRLPEIRPPAPVPEMFTPSPALSRSRLSWSRTLGAVTTTAWLAQLPISHDSTTEPVPTEIPRHTWFAPEAVI